MRTTGQGNSVIRGRIITTRRFRNPFFLFTFSRNTQPGCATRAKGLAGYNFSGSLARARDNITSRIRSEILKPQLFKSVVARFPSLVRRYRVRRRTPRSSRRNTFSRSRRISAAEDRARAVHCASRKYFLRGFAHVLSALRLFSSRTRAA